MRNKLNAAIIGPGNIGSDLMMKILGKSKFLDLKLVTGIVADSPGLARAREKGIAASSDGIGAILDRGDIEIAFDATTASAHMEHAPLLREAGIVAIDPTPAAIGPFVMPVVNLDDHLEAMNINLITCGGQSTIPRILPVKYAEIVATISSRSAGPGTRQNIDEFTQTTARGVIEVGGARTGKAIILLNPADPPMMMNNTVYALTDADISPGDQARILDSVNGMVARVQSFVPGYRLKIPPMFEGSKVTVMVEVTGAGDFLPAYSGNLDIETSAALAIAEKIAEHRLAKAARNGKE